MEGRQRRRSAAGFTLVEVLIGLVIMSLIGLALAAISVPGLISMRDGSTERHLDAVAAQWTSFALGRDVQGALGTSASQCPPGPGGTRLVTLQTPTAGRFVTYYRTGADGSYSLLRKVCGEPGGDGLDVEEIQQEPTITCVPGPCVADSSSLRSVRLTVGRTASFSFSVDGATRRVTSTTTAVPVTPSGRPSLFALGGGGNSLFISGNGRLQVTGEAVVNSNSSTAIHMDGNQSRLSVSPLNEVRILQGGLCSPPDQPARCAPPIFPQLVTYSVPLADPLASLPQPLGADLQTGSCSPVGGQTVCQPGVYGSRLDANGTVLLRPGVYVLRQGLRIASGGSVTGNGVFFFNGCPPDQIALCPTAAASPAGTYDSTDAGRQYVFSISGSGTVNLTPLRSGPYADILLFQARANRSIIEISGNSNVNILEGLMYAPASKGFNLASGNGTLSIGAVIGSNLRVEGGGASGTVVINGLG
jgi:prepilin-type N-terminal cleavage/methylation domain-containing protein